MHSDWLRIGELWLIEGKIILKTRLDFYSSLNRERLLDNDQQYLENLCPNFDKGYPQLASKRSPYMDCPDSNNDHLPMLWTEKMQVSFLFYLENEKYKKHIKHKITISKQVHKHLGIKSFIEV